MVRQVSAGYSVGSLEIKVPQQYIERVMRAQIVATQGSNRMINSLHFLAPTSPVTVADCDSVGDMLVTWISSFYAALVHTSVAFEFVHVRSMEGYTVAKSTKSLTGVAGAVGMDVLPPGTCCVVGLQTTTTGHQNHGLMRLFVTGEEENAVNGKPAAAYLSSCEDAITTLLGDATTIGMPLVIASYTYRTYAIVNTIEMSREWGSLPSRKPGRGM